MFLGKVDELSFVRRERIFIPDAVQLNAHVLVAFFGQDRERSANKCCLGDSCGGANVVETISSACGWFDRLLFINEGEWMRQRSEIFFYISADKSSFLCCIEMWELETVLRCFQISVSNPRCSDRLEAKVTRNDNWLIIFGSVPGRFASFFKHEVS